MVKSIRGTLGPVLIGAGLLLVVSPVVLYWFIHGDPNATSGSSAAPHRSAVSEAGPSSSTCMRAWSLQASSPSRPESSLKGEAVCHERRRTEQRNRVSRTPLVQGSVYGRL